MAVNEENEDQRKGRAIGRISSQAGLNALAGGRAKSLPSIPAPGQPGSRFNAVVVDRGERMSREEGVKAPGTKSLPLNMPQGMIQGIPPAIMNQTRDGESEQTVAGAAAQGFAGGFLGGLQNRMFGSSSGGQQDDLPEFIDHRTLPTNQKGEPLTPDEYITLSRQRHAIEKASIERGEMGLNSMLPGQDRTRVEEALNSRRQIMQDSVTRTDSFERSMRSQGFLAPTNSPAEAVMNPARGGGQAGANLSWHQNNSEAVALNTKIMAASAENIALMDRDIAAMNQPSDVGLRVQLIAARAKALEGFRAMQISMAHDQVNVDVHAGAHTDTDVTALQENLSQLRVGNDQMRANQQQRGGAEPPAKNRSRTAPVRNADGKTLADLTAPAPGEDPLPGTAQPLLLDALDAAQGIPPRRAAKGVARTVVMNPAHVAALASLDNGHEAGLESSGSHFGR